MAGLLELQRTGGVGAALAQLCLDAGVTTPVHALGLPRAFIPRAPAPRCSPMPDWTPQVSYAPS
ncbi:hypothetical protein [Streptomyces sp. BP-8]|uniref:Uncharacterized protein n=1 Tax=Streptomyces sirii TaxID=3127701 RepID=A0ABZ2QX59_9ACTN